jgi:hypothetical protein
METCNPLFDASKAANMPAGPPPRIPNFINLLLILSKKQIKKWNNQNNYDNIILFKGKNIFIG